MEVIAKLKLDYVAFKNLCKKYIEGVANYSSSKEQFSVNDIQVSFYDDAFMVNIRLDRTNYEVLYFKLGSYRIVRPFISLEEV